MNRVIAVCILVLSVMAATSLVAAQDTPGNATQENETNITNDTDLGLEENQTNVSTVIIASATNYPDALVASSAAEKTGSPILIAGEEAVEGAATNDTGTSLGGPIGNETTGPAAADNQTADNASGDGGGLLGGLGGNDQQNTDTMQILPGVAAQQDQQDDGGLLGGIDADNATAGNATAENDTAVNATDNETEENVTVEERTAAIEGAAVQQLAPETRDKLEQLNPDEVVLVGGPQVLGTNISEALEAEDYDVTRLWGYTRYGTAVEVANYFWPEGTESAMLVENERQSPNFQTVASAAELAEHQEEPMYLTPEGRLPAATLASLHHLNVDDVTVVSTNMTDAYEQDLDEAGISIENEITANDSVGLQVALWDELQDILATTDHLVVTASDDYHHAIAAASDPVMTTLHVSGNATGFNETGINETTTGPVVNETVNATENQSAVNVTENETEENETDTAQMQIYPLDGGNDTGNATNRTENQSASERSVNETGNVTAENESVAAEEAVGLPLDVVLAEIEGTDLENATVVGTETAGQDVAGQLEDAGLNVTTILGPAENVSQLNREFIDLHMERFEDASQRWQEMRDELLDENEEAIAQRIATLMVQTERMMGEDAPQEAANALERASQRLDDQQYWEALQSTMEARNTIQLDRFEQIADTNEFDRTVDAEMLSLDQSGQRIGEMNQAFADAFENEPLEVRLWIVETVRHMSSDETQQVFDRTMELWDEGDDLLPPFEQARSQVQAGEFGEDVGADEPGPVGNETTTGNQTGNASLNGTDTNSTAAMLDGWRGVEGNRFVTDTRCLTGNASQNQEIRAVDSTILAAGNVILPTPNFNASSNVTVDDSAQTVDIQANFTEGEGVGIQCVGEGAFVQAVTVDDGNWDVAVETSIGNETAWTASETVQVPATDDDMIERDDGNRSMITNETRSGTV